MLLLCSLIFDKILYNTRCAHMKNANLDQHGILEQRNVNPIFARRYFSLNNIYRPTETSKWSDN